MEFTTEEIDLLWNMVDNARFDNMDWRGTRFDWNKGELLDSILGKLSAE